MEFRSVFNARPAVSSFIPVDRHRATGLFFQSVAPRCRPAEKQKAGIKLKWPWLNRTPRKLVPLLPVPSWKRSPALPAIPTAVD